MNFFSDNLYLLWIVVTIVSVGILHYTKPTKNSRNYRQHTAFDFPSNKETDISLVSKSEYQKKPLMNKSEYQFYCKLYAHLEKYHKAQHFRLFSQVAMGEFIGSEDTEAFHKINGKRVDFLIINSKGLPMVVIEYQGKGHYQDNAVERDAIKREACRKAGIEFIEIKPNYGKLEFELISKSLNLSLQEDNRKLR